MTLNAALAQRLEDIARMMDLMGEDSFKAIAHSPAAPQPASAGLLAHRPGLQAW